tara:strand:+ start:959 stop:1525 length:567 start_codon:yes stop_codon:yes gene_type:complete
MNIFVLDKDPQVSAQMMCDKHVVKMIVESAQMLSTVHRYLDGDEFISISKNGRRIKRWTHDTDDINSDIRLFKSVMLNHPCTIWTRQSLGNYCWLASHALHLCREYTHRYNREHKTEGLVNWFVDNYPQNLHGFHLTEFAQAMPEEYKVSKDAPLAYQKYYIGEKKRFAKWTNRSIPDWWHTPQKVAV